MAAPCRSAGDAEGERIGKRVPEQGLERHAGDGERCADGGGEEDARESQPQEDRTRGSVVERDRTESDRDGHGDAEERGEEEDRLEETLHA
jgi:hypothetical protein